LWVKNVIIISISGLPKLIFNKIYTKLNPNVKTLPNTSKTIEWYFPAEIEVIFFKIGLIIGIFEYTILVSFKPNCPNYNNNKNLHRYFQKQKHLHFYSKENYNIFTNNNENSPAEISTMIKFWIFIVIISGCDIELKSV
jgi:hypothetical protein